MQSRVEAAGKAPSPRILQWVFLLVVIQAAICFYYAQFAVIDDAFIAMRYAVNFVHGHGLVFNARAAPATKEKVGHQSLKTRSLTFRHSQAVSMMVSIEE